MNLIGTSINIEKSRLARLNNAAEQLNLSETELLSMLLEKSRKLFGGIAVTKQTVKYQRDCDEAKYAIHHIVFSDVDYEFATGRRYVFKISVSFLIRLAIDAFLTEIIREWIQTPAEAAMAREEYLTNSCIQFFDIVRFVKYSAEFWLIPWPRT